MYLSYDIVKIILEIKYNNWVIEKQCLCGEDDYKECDIIQCYACSNHYCLNQKEFSRWIWQCFECREYYCGYHEFRMNIDRYKYCDNCIYPDCFQIAIKNEIHRLPLRKVIALNKHRAKTYNYSPIHSPDLTE